MTESPLPVNKQVSFVNVGNTGDQPSLLGEASFKKMEEDDDEFEEKARMKQLKKLKEEQVYNQFQGLCDNLVSAYASLNSSLEEVMSAKDGLLSRDLPPSVQANMTLKSSRLMRSYSDMKVPINELTRLVRNYAQPWHLKSEALKKLHSQYDQKKRMLDVALRRLQLTAEQIDQFETQKTLSHWEKLYSRVTGKRGHGRRWKFRFMHFKKKADQGFEFLQSYLDGIDREGDRDPTPQFDRHNFSLQKSPMGADGLEDSDLEDEEAKEEEEEGSGQGEESGSEDDALDGTSKMKSGSSKKSGRRQRRVVETAEAETSTHFDRFDRYLCARVVKVEGAGFAKRDQIFLNVKFNGKIHSFSNEQIEEVLIRERPKSGVSQGSQGVLSDGKSGNTSPTKSLDSEVVKALEVIRWPLEEDVEEEMIEIGSQLERKQQNIDEAVNKDGTQNAGEERKDVMTFDLSESKDGDVLCHASASLESIQDTLPPTVDLPDYFGNGEDEGEFLLKDEPTVLTLTTVHGKVTVGALSVHFYYGVTKRPFIAPKEAQTDPHLVEGVVEQILGVDLKKVSLDQLMQGAEQVSRQPMRDRGTSPVAELQQMIPAVDASQFALSTYEQSMIDMQQSQEKQQPLPPEEPDSEPAQAVPDPVAADNVSPVDETGVIETREEEETQEENVQITEDTSRPSSRKDNAQELFISKDQCEEILRVEKEKYTSVIENYKGEVDELRMTIEQLERALEGIKSELERKKSEKIRSRYEALSPNREVEKFTFGHGEHQHALESVNEQSDEVERDDANNDSFNTVHLGRVVAKSSHTISEPKLPEIEENKLLEEANSPGDSGDGKLDFDRIGESELYNVGGEGDTRRYEHTGRSLATGDVYTNRQHLDQDATFRSNEAFATGSPKEPETKPKQEPNYDQNLDEFEDGDQVKKRKKRIHYPLPDWSSNLSKNFLERQREFWADRSVHVRELRNAVRGVRAQHIEAQMKGQHRLSREPTLINTTSVTDDSLPLTKQQAAMYADPLEEVCLPALFMPTRTGVIYNPRAGKSVAPSGASLRLTQPPSIFQLPALPPSAAQLLNDDHEFLDILGNVPLVAREPHFSSRDIITFSNYDQVEEIKRLNRSGQLAPIEGGNVDHRANNGVLTSNRTVESNASKNKTKQSKHPVAGDSHKTIQANSISPWGSNALLNEETLS